ncbi:LysR family transcriptional regulator [Afipia sp. GAS231]|uniref:LysR family transcriptional regulator n=1 Tax=Afipia sp. GAS231 TaxID=1882747 RepID=UPI00087D138D|nr:LysR family transcriptional regulator [Afipia sp. GAS231]SDO09705.1 DNA-binding transcriptional regulator, LysR family [Afipia sp. GAS231]
MNLRSIDLNLLVLFDALIEVRSVRRAGERIGLSQSATSHALDRLRKLLGDELLVRTASGMEPTPRALSLAGPVRLALQDIQTALAPDRFEPAEAEIGLTIAVETHETIVVLPLLVEEIRREAPGIVLTVRSGSVEDILNGVDQGRVDVAIGLFNGLPDRFMTSRLLSDVHACVMRADHPLARSPLTLERYLEAPHLLISMSGGTTNAVDNALAEQGLRRHIAMQMPHGLAAVMALTRSDMVTSVTRGVARVFAATAPAVVMDLPFPVPPSTFRLVWHRRFQADPARMWLRRKLVAIAAAIEAAKDDG